MKLFYTISISLLILLSSFSNAFVYLNFKLNQKEIAATLCIKKEIKNNGCNGKCYLAKQLKKEAEKEKKEAEILKEKQEVLYSFSYPNYNITTLFKSTQKKNIFITTNSKTKTFTASHFRPPLT